MHLDKAVTSLLAGVGIAGVALGFAFQDITANLLSGVALVINKDYPFKVKDIIETNDFIGYVEEISLRSTTISTFQGQTVIIPNRVIYENPLVNYSFTQKRRVDLEIGVSYGDDLKKVVDITMQAIQDIDRDKSKVVEVFYKEFGSSSINLELRFWVPFKDPNQYLEARHQAIIAVKEAFDANNITIPFPIRTLDFGIKGGKTLENMLAN
jgi:small conductance mechanosensitive channel